LSHPRSSISVKQVAQFVLGENGLTVADVGFDAGFDTGEFVGPPPPMTHSAGF